MELGLLIKTTLNVAGKRSSCSFVFELTAKPDLLSLMFAIVFLLLNTVITRLAISCCDASMAHNH